MPTHCTGPAVAGGVVVPGVDHADDHVDAEVFVAIGPVRAQDGPGPAHVDAVIARRVLTLAYYGLRDGEIRCLTQPVEAA